VKLSHWFRHNAWLVIGCVVVLMVVQTGTKDAESPPKSGLEQSLSGLDQAERDRLKSRIQAWNQLQAPEQASIRKLHTAVMNDQELADTFENYHAWLASLPGDPDAVRNELQSEPDLQKRVRIVSRYLDQEHNAGSDPQMRPDPTDRYPSAEGLTPRQTPPAGFVMRGPVLNGQEFVSAIEIIAEWCAIPEATHGRSMTDIFEYQLNVLVNLDRKLSLPPNSPVRQMIALREPIRKIIDSIQEEEQSIRIGIDIEDKPINLMLLLIRSIRSEAIRQVNSVSDADLKRLIEDLPEDRRRFLTLNTSPDTRKRVVMLWLEEKHPELWDMIKKYGRFARDSTQLRKKQYRRPDQNRIRPAPQSL